MHKNFVIVCLSRESLPGKCYWNSALVPLSLAENIPVIFFEPLWENLVGIVIKGIVTVSAFPFMLYFTGFLLPEEKVYLVHGFKFLRGYVIRPFTK